MAIYGGRVSPYSCRPVSGPLIVQMMGDSITAGPLTLGGWRAYFLYLASVALGNGGAVGPGGVIDSMGDLNNALYGYDPSCGTSHSGHSGSSAAQWITNGWMSTFNPGTVHIGMLMLGANDGGDLVQTATDIMTLANQFFSLHPMANLFVSNRLERSFAATSVMNAALASQVATARTSGKNIVLVDNHAVIDLADTTDGLHPGTFGNQKLAENWFASVAPYLR